MPLAGIKPRSHLLERVFVPVNLAQAGLHSQ